MDLVADNPDAVPNTPFIPSGLDNIVENTPVMTSIDIVETSHTTEMPTLGGVARGSVDEEPFLFSLGMDFDAT